MIKLTTFQKAVDCIEKGGAAQRYGVYPIYAKGSIGTVIAMYATNQIQSVGFTLDEQNAKDWVLTSPKVYKVYQKKQQKFWNEYLAQQVKIPMQTANTPIETASTSNIDVFTGLPDKRTGFQKLMDWLEKKIG